LGHNGLIGSALLRTFRKLGFLNLITIERKELELTEYSHVNNFLKSKKPEIVIIAAGKVGGIIENRDFPVDFLYENLNLELSVFKACVDNNVKKVIFFGSSCMYPKITNQPMKEHQLFSSPMEETSMAYSISKHVGMQLANAFNSQYGSTNFITLIPNSAYGPFDNFDPKSSHVLSSLIYKFHLAKQNNIDIVELWGSGKPMREFIHSEDIASACIKILEYDSLPFESPINIGVGYDISIRDLAKMISSMVGYGGEIYWDKSKPDGTSRKLLDNSKIESLGWRPKYNLEQGIHHTYNWYKNYYKNY